MKTIYRISVMALGAIMMMTSCGSAGAQNDKKKVKNEVAVKTVTELDADSFNTKVYNIKAAELKYLGDKPAIVDFTAKWCGPCQRITPILEDLAEEFGDKIVIYKVDIDKERGLAETFNVSSIPAILYIPTGGREPVMTVGSRSKEKFKEEINTILLPGTIPWTY